MSNHNIDDNRTVRDSRNNEIGKADYDGQVRDGWRDKGKIENGRYVDEHGRDWGWVSKVSSGGGWESALMGIGLLLVFGIFYLMFLGIKWLFVEGKKSLAHASRSWGIASLVIFPPVFFMALITGYNAIKGIEANRGPAEQKGIAQAGIVMGIIGGLLCVMAAVVMVISLIVTIFNQ